MEDEKNGYASEYMTAQEAADLLHVTRKTVYVWASEGRLKRYRVRDVERTLFKSEDVRALIEEA